MTNGNAKLVGTWKLVSASSSSPSGEQNGSPFDPNPVGILTYTGDGRVSVLISYGGRKQITTGAQTATLIEEQAEAFRTFFAYAGRYRLSGDSIVHSIEISSIENYVGKELVRSLKFQGDQIALVTPPTMVNGKIQSVELVWQRLEAAS
jgi:hypothetical protein